MEIFSLKIFGIQLSSSTLSIEDDIGIESKIVVACPRKVYYRDDTMLTCIWTLTGSQLM